MNVLYDSVVVIHFVGLASLLGGFLVQMGAPQRGINLAMVHGALTQLVTGLILVGMREADIVEGEDPLNTTKITIKLTVALVVVVVVLLGRRKPPEARTPYWAVAGALTLVNVVVAVFA